MDGSSRPVTVPAADLGSVEHRWLLPALALLVIGSMLAAYWPSVASAVAIWSTSDTYAHGYLIAPISAWFAYQSRHALARTPQSPTWWALPVIAGLGAFWAVAMVADVQVLQQLAVVGLVAAIVLALLGTAWCRVLAFPLGFLVLAVPMGDGLVPHLIDMTADFVVAALRLSGIPVYREGTFFIIPSGSWSVVSGCSGMRYLMATITVGVLFAYLNYRAWWRRVAFVVIAALVAIGANWLRAYGIVMIAHLSDMKLALGVDHYVYGWVFFGIVIFLLMSIGMIWSEPPRPTVDRAAPLPEPHAVPSRTRMLALTLAVVVAVHAWPWLARLAVAEVGYPALPVEPIAPAALDGRFTPEPDPALDWTPTYEGKAQALAQSWRDANGLAGFYLAWYPVQRQGAEVTSARNHIVHEKFEPWRPETRGVVRDPAPGLPAARQMLLHERAGSRRLLVWHWYWVGGQTTVSRAEAKRFEALSRLRGRGNPAAALIVYAEVGEGEQVSVAAERLRGFAGQAVPALHAVLATATARQ